MPNFDTLVELQTDELIDSMYQEDYTEEEIDDIEDRRRDCSEDLYFDFMSSLTLEYAKLITRRN